MTSSEGSADSPPGPEGDGPAATSASRRPAGVPVGADALLEGLTEPQREAVVHRGGPLLIVAGAGSGKTRVLTRRIAHLIATGDATPWQILAITFTNKAADEMRTRVAELVGPRGQRMWVSTFHSACVRILRAHGDRLGYKGSFTIYDDADSRRLVEIVARELDIDTKKMSPRSIVGQISQAKSRQQGPDEYRAAAATIFDRRIADVFDLYQQRLVAANAMDFDDLLLNTVRLLPAPPRRARPLPDPLHPHPGRRVPGHQRRAERPGRSAGRRATATSWWSGTATSRSTGSGVPTSPTSSSSSRPSPTPRPSSWTRTSGPPRPSSTPPMP